MHENASKLLIMHAGALGDFILALPAIAALRRHFPTARIRLAARANILELAVNSSYLDDSLDIDGSGVHHLFGTEEIPAFLAGYLAGFDLIVSWFGAGDASYVRNLRRCNPRSLIARPFPPSNSGQHVSDYLLSTLAPLGITNGEPTPAIRADAKLRARGAEIIAEYRSDRGYPPKRPLIVIHPGSGGKQKCWPAENFARLIDQLTEDFDAVIFLLQGPAEDSPDSAAVRQVLARIKRAETPVLKGLHLDELAGLLAQCHLFVGNDSGATHLAAAVGVPVVAIFGATDPRVWGPRGADVTVVRHKSGFLEKIRVAAVLDKIARRIHPVISI